MELAIIANHVVPLSLVYMFLGTYRLEWQYSVQGNPYPFRIATKAELSSALRLFSSRHNVYLHCMYRAIWCVLFLGMELIALSITVLYLFHSCPAIFKYISLLFAFLIVWSFIQWDHGELTVRRFSSLVINGEYVVIYNEKDQVKKHARKISRNHTESFGQEGYQILYKNDRYYIAFDGKQPIMIAEIKRCKWAKNAIGHFADGEHRLTRRETRERRDKGT